MARVTYGSTITELKGSIGGTTFQSNRYGFSAKNKSHPRVSFSARRGAQQGYSAFAMKSWGNLSDAQRSEWETFASSYPQYAKNNPTSELSGYAVFLKWQQLDMLRRGSASITTYVPAQDSPSLPVPTPTLTRTYNALSLGVSWDISSTDWYCLLFASGPVPQTKTYIGSQTKYLQTIDSDDTTVDITTAFTSLYGRLPYLGEYVFLEFLLIKNDGGQVQARSSFQLFVNYDWTSLGQQYSQGQITSLCYLESGICLAGAYNGGLILRSTNYGASWSSLGQQFSQTNYGTVVYLGSGICLAGSYPAGHIIRSTNYGASWSDLGQQFSQTEIVCLSYMGNGMCIAGTLNGGLVLRSTDYGVTWSNIGQLGSETAVYCLSYVGNGVCIAGTYPNGHIYRSTDFGVSWSDLGQQASETTIRSIISLGGGICLAGTGTNGHILRSTNYGLTWSDLGQQSSQNTIWALFYVGNGVCLAGTYSGGLILISTDYGLTWSSLVQQESETYIRCFAKTDTGIILVGTSNNGLILH